MLDSHTLHGRIHSFTLGILFDVLIVAVHAAVIRTAVNSSAYRDFIAIKKEMNT